jgi:Fe-Mn family superoxide dismutase
MSEMEIFGNSLTRRDAVKVGAASMFTFLAASGTADGDNMRKDKLMNDLMIYENGKYVLPDLPYNYDALEPYYDQQTLKLHHDKHHAGYVKKFNAALDKLAQARDKGDYSSVQALSNELAFNGSGHVLHTLFWNSMTPGGSDMTAELKEAFEQSFGSVEKGRSHFAAATKAVEASGWGVLAFEPYSQKLIVLQCEKHQNLTIWSAVPLMVCDVWEHAYYLKYQNNRGDWVDNFMKITNWKFVSDRLMEAKKIFSC